MTKEPPLVQRGHLQLAANFTRDAWFPLTAEGAQALSRLEKSGGPLPEELISTIKNDLALASLVTRALLPEMQDTDQPGGISRLRSLSAAALQRLASPEQRSGLRHTFADPGDWQISRIQEALVSVTTAETLSPSFELDEDLAYTCALLRQLGLSLLAWNYPHVFKRALTVIRPNETLDYTLGKILGFTPGLLTLTILRASPAPRVILKVLGDSWTRQPDSNQERELVEQLSSVCNVAEMMARATSTVIYPSSAKDWETACAEFERRLGKSGWPLLEDALNNRLASYRSAIQRPIAVPEVLQQLSGFARKTLGPVTLFERNSWARQCDPGTQTIMREYYLRIASPGMAQPALSFLLNRTRHRIGCSLAAIYLRNGSSNQFSPYLSAGCPSEQLPLYLVDAVLAAAGSRTPIWNPENEARDWISGTVGETQRSAVLFLEFKDRDTKSANARLTAFRALAQAISDGLEIF